MNSSKKQLLSLSKGKGKGGKGKCLPMSAPVGKSSSQAKAGLSFSVSRVTRFMRQGRYADRIGSGAPVYMASILQYLCEELIELSGGKTESFKLKTIKPRHVMLAIREDPELNKLLGAGDYAECGVVPNIHGGDKKAKKGKKQCMVNDDMDMDDEQ